MMILGVASATIKGDKYENTKDRPYHICDWEADARL